MGFVIGIIIYAVVLELGRLMLAKLFNSDS
jgi:hypothetical protein